MEQKHVSMVRAAISPERGKADHIETGDSDRAVTVFEHRAKRRGQVSEVYTPNEPLLRLHETLHARHTDPLGAWPEVSEITRQVIEDIKMHTQHWPWPSGGTPRVLKASIRRIADRELSTLKHNLKVMKGREDKGLRAQRLATIARILSLPGGDDIISEMFKSRKYTGMLTGPEFNMLRRVVYLASRAETWERAAVMFEALIGGITPEKTGKDSPKKTAKTYKPEIGARERPVPHMGTNVEKMTVIDLPKPAACTTQVKSETEYASCGRTINYRELLRGKLFMRPNRLFTREYEENFRGGSVLIDASGSMCINQEGLERLCKQLPAATIAYYGGNDSDSNPVGYLVIYAKDGKRADHVREVPGGNSVDRPALKWLLDQEGPRYFITDEGFCGAGDYSSLAFAQLQAAKASGAVTVITNISKAKIYFGVKG